MSRSADPPPVPEGDPEEWSDTEKAQLYRYVAELDLGENVTQYLQGQAEALDSRGEQ